VLDAAIRDLGDLELRVDRCVDLTQLAPSVEIGDEFLEIRVHRSSLVLKANRKSLARQMLDAMRVARLGGSEPRS